ncbi:hypothetical protein FF011L_28490 [Roseimaritima multifibrata]|uniref:Uncharacterized protein n=1 Tax=Roseimaritima multifibrata TaxID=1930274 RepID=A0A517MGR6_9BACT|nr:hypothetical protein FF011L_28490 [Roseimaritima multifibrata]
MNYIMPNSSARGHPRRPSIDEKLWPLGLHIRTRHSVRGRGSRSRRYLPRDTGWREFKAWGDRQAYQRDATRLVVR